MSESIDRCPICKGQPTIGTEAISGKPMVACMNICCSNMNKFVADYVGEAVAEWNNWCKTKESEVPSIKPNYRKCRECKWLDMEQKVVIGQLCNNPDKRFRTNTAIWKYPSTKACKMFEERSEMEVLVDED